MASEWWLNNSGDCLLKGVEGDQSNPIRLDDATIIGFLRTYLEARRSFNRLYPTLLTEEQTRMDWLVQQTKFMYVPDHTLDDAIQNQANRAGVHTCGPRGGNRMQR